jgi:hypothetical protein
LDVFLVDGSHHGGFAPVQLTLSIWDRSAGGGIVRLALTFHSPLPAEIRVAPGMVNIRGHKDSEQDAYCFGGNLACERAGDRLRCRLTSSAPILNLGEEGMDWPENVVLRVVDSIESDIATCHAQYQGEEEAAFDERLARTDPRLLYAVGLTRAQRSFSMLPDIMRTEHYWDEHTVLARALREAEQSDWWPSDPSLPAVLPPPH